jgi:hypothetical protein
VVPLDDNVAPAAYVPLTSHLLRHLSAFTPTAAGVARSE